ncbi:MAG: GntR family transcriptional regulator [Pseudomonadota bacterium]|uniref:DNA-binding transcriptional regulator, GntR family n=1 Tax=Marinobacter gudaonensis TaxID=375760 RepID=A0A1I6HTR7_9GAMM|nr:GntR family transcriptional regulator [Marinobacter gudaonensis]MEE3170183.1 GntR family transcriptional regulator [Pseudomonadota bacterium]SFR57823.1 DNA-binding transcriptional regulator, GntR family [Marinobacter gudaonensis]
MKRSNAQKLKDALEEDIINGRLLPGDKLDHDALAEKYNVSRTPIREAVQQLVVSGLVIVKPKKGTFVAKVGFDQLIEMFEVMAELEGMCGRLAARRIQPSELERLRTALERCEDRDVMSDPDEYYYENEEFHSCIYDASHNGFLASEARQLKQRLKPYRRLQLQARNRVSNSAAEHRRIYDAIASGNELEAERALKEHVLIQGTRFSDFVSQIRKFGHATPATA